MDFLRLPVESVTLSGGSTAVCGGPASQAATSRAARPPDMSDDESAGSEGSSESGPTVTLEVDVRVGNPEETVRRARQTVVSGFVNIDDALAGVQPPRDMCCAVGAFETRACGRCDRAFSVQGSGVFERRSIVFEAAFGDVTLLEFAAAAACDGAPLVDGIPSSGGHMIKVDRQSRATV